jgi:hypothetical protein
MDILARPICAIVAEIALNIIGESRVMQTALELSSRAGASNATVPIAGERGTRNLSTRSATLPVPYNNEDPPN